MTAGARGPGQPERALQASHDAFPSPLPPQEFYIPLALPPLR